MQRSTLQRVTSCLTRQHLLRSVCSPASLPPHCKCFSCFSQWFTQLIPKFTFCWPGTSNRRSLHSVLFQVQLKILLLNTMGRYEPESPVMCVSAEGLCESVPADPWRQRHPTAKPALRWAALLTCVEWITESTLQVGNQPILYQRMFAVKQR